jgi:hypothetical protein
MTINQKSISSRLCSDSSFAVLNWGLVGYIPSTLARQSQGPETTVNLDQIALPPSHTLRLQPFTGQCDSVREAGSYSTCLILTIGPRLPL